MFPSASQPPKSASKAMNSSLFFLSVALVVVVVVVVADFERLNLASILYSLDAVVTGAVVLIC